jgi:large subunit ribosomal protein L24
MKYVGFHIRKNDLVEVLSGKEKGKTGKVLRVYPKKDRVLVEKVNFVKRHTKPTGRTRQGGIIQKEAPLHVSNVLLVCPKCNQGKRMGTKILEDGKKALVCRACGEQMERK